MEGKVELVIDPRTVTVLVEDRLRHPFYPKVIKRVKKLLVHVPEGVNPPQKGAVVAVKSSRPISKRKKWILEKVIG